MILQATLTIRASRTPSGMIYILWITFSPDLVKALGWSVGQRLSCTWFSKALRFDPITDKQHKGVPPKLGRYKSRPGTLWTRYTLTPSQRQQFLKTYSNGFSTKVQYAARGMFALNGRLILSGKGTPIKGKKR